MRNSGCSSGRRATFLVNNIGAETDEERGKRACVLSARRSISKALKDSRGDQRKAQQIVGRTGARALELTPPVRNVPRHCVLLGGVRYKAARRAVREQGRSKTGVASLPHVKRAPMSALVSCRRSQEYQDAIISFWRVGQRRRLFRGLDIRTVKRATGDLSEKCRFFLNTQLMFWKRRVQPRSSSTMMSGFAR